MLCCGLVDALCILVHVGIFLVSAELVVLQRLGGPRLQLVQPLLLLLLDGGKTCFLGILLGFNPGVFSLSLVSFTLLLI